jgi:hypothetical protein
MNQQRQPSPNEDEATISLGMTDGISEELDGFEWDFSGYDLGHFVGDLKDLKKAVALLSADTEPQLSVLETIRIARDKDDDKVYLVMVIKEDFVHLQIALETLLRDHARYTYHFERISHRIIPVQELSENGDLVIPGEAIAYLTNPLVFDRFTIDTEDESFLHTF